MGFFTTKTDPIATLKKQIEKNPKDHKALLDVAGMLKAKGALADAADHYMRAAKVLSDLGFMPKGVAIAKQVTSMQPKLIEPYEFLVACYEEMKVKEDLRTLLKTLTHLYRAEGRESQAKGAEAKLDALGPGR